MVLAGAALALIVSAAFAVLLAAISDIRANERLAHRSEGTAVVVNKLSRLLTDIDTGARLFALTYNPAQLQRWQSARAEFSPTYATLQTLVRGDPAGEQQAQRIARDQSAFVDTTIAVVNAARQGGGPNRSRASVATQRFDTARSDLDALLAIETRASAASAAASVRIVRRASISAAVGLGGSIALVALYTAYLSRAIVRPTRHAATMAGRLAGGDLAARLAETGPGEIGALERAFNVMGASLERNRDELATVADEQAALRRVATLVARAELPATVFATVAREIGRLLPVQATAIGRYDADGTKITNMGTWVRSGNADKVPSTFSASGQNVAALVWKTGRPARMNSYENASGPTAAFARALSLKSSVGAPINVAGRLWGVVIVASTSDEQLPADTEMRLADFTELAATAIANTEARAEVTASRARLVFTADETRRRIERDLHDGAQQRFIALALQLRSAQAAVPSYLDPLAGELDHVTAELTNAIDELREFARGIHPAILAEGGLGPALRTLARRAAVPVELEVRTDARLPERVEVAAYYVVSEALANAAKHAQASRVAVDLEAGDNLLRVGIRDDGVGGATFERGSGLVGLKDRVEALGGRIALQSEPGAGTSISVKLPLADAAGESS